jgi:hypothetical protein
MGIASKKVAAIVLMMVQVTAVLLLCIAATVECTLLHPAHYRSVLRHTEIPLYLYNDWNQQFAEIGEITAEERLQAVMIRAFGEEFDPAWLDEQLEGIIEDALHFLKGETGTLTATIDFKEKKEHVAASLADALASTPKEMRAAWGIESDDLQEAAGTLVQNRIRLSDVLSVAEEIFGEPEDVVAAYAALTMPRTVRRWYILAPLFLLALLVGLDVLIRGVRAGGIRVGRSLMTAGFIVMGAGVAAGAFLVFRIFGGLHADLRFLTEIMVVFVARTLAVLLLFGGLCLLVGWLSVRFGKPVRAPRSRRNPTSIHGISVLSVATLAMTIMVLSGSCVSTPTGDESSTGNVPDRSETASDHASPATDTMASSPGMDRILEGMTMIHDTDIVVAGTTVVPHTASGEIPSYNRKDPFVYAAHQGALIRIFVRNNSSEDAFTGTVLFNGKTGRELLEEDIVSWCNVPDTREAIGLLTSDIPPRSMDVYVLNIQDSRFYEDGMTLTFIDEASKTYWHRKVEVRTPEVFPVSMLFYDPSAKEKARRP